CCSREDAGDARRVADLLGIPFYVWDFAERFRADVIDDFVESYARGETPNPCLRCNERIKFEALLERGIAWASTPWPRDTTPGSPRRSCRTGRAGRCCGVPSTRTRTSPMSWACSLPNSWRTRCSRWGTRSSPR